MPMMNNRGWNIPSAPTEQPRAQTQVGIVAEGEEHFVEAAGFFEDLAMVQSRAGVRPKNFFRFVILTNVGFHCAPAAILTIPIDEMAGLVDHARRASKKNFAGEHTDPPGGITTANQFRQPIRFRNGITVEESDPFASGLRECQVIPFAEAAVVRKQDG